MNNKKLLLQILNSQKNVKFTDFTKLVLAFGFYLDRVSGSHHIFAHSDISDIINLQDVCGDAKPYQIKQFLKIIEKYNLRLKD
jgi:predicted RNA binding protein YcfA (HicA-like mRNA interferase family)